MVERKIKTKCLNIINFCYLKTTLHTFTHDTHVRRFQSRRDLEINPLGVGVGVGVGVGAK